MILVGQYDSPFVRRVAVSLHVLGLPFTRKPISGFADAEQMRTINPLGRIPSLVLDDGEVIIDSGAILDHLDGVVGPERALLPPPGPERRRALYAICLATGLVEKAGAIVYERTLRPPEKQHAPWVARCRTQVDSALAALEVVTAAAGPFTVERPAASPKQQHITLACALAYLPGRLPEAFVRGSYPALEAFAASFARVPAFMATEPSPEEAMPGRPLG
jgi:glutathione S-transferase